MIGSHMKERDNNIDLLRFIGLSLIILAHVSPPLLVLNIRCFDVPLMVFISGLTCYNKNVPFSWNYLSHRFARLVFPVWIFLSVYFTPIILLKFLGIDLGLKFQHVWGSYLLLNGIGYVWIIRVFLLIALLTPLLTRINTLIKNNVNFILCYSGLLALYLFLTFYRIGYDIDIIRDWMYYAIGYSFLFLLGLRIKSFGIRTKLGLLFIMILIFITLSIIDIDVQNYTDSIFYHVNDWKYPPVNIYLIYGIIMSVLIFSLVYLVQRTKLNPFVRFVGCNSIWIYLWHIPIVAITEKIDMAYWSKYVIVYTLAIIIYNIQLYIVKHIKSKKYYGLLKYLEG